MQEWEERILEQQKAVDKEYLLIIRRNLDSGKSIEEIADFLGKEVQEIQTLITKLE